MSIKLYDSLYSPESTTMNDNNLSRSKLHNTSTMEWLSKRYMQCASYKYLYLPEEIHNHDEIKTIFEHFDEDKSGKLSIAELHNMMEKMRIIMDKKDLESICRTVDLNNDNALTLNEFKHCALSEKTDEQFKKIIRKIRQEFQEKGFLKHHESKKRSRQFSQPKDRYETKDLNHRTRAEKREKAQKEEKVEKEEKEDKGEKIEKGEKRERIEKREKSDSIERPYFPGSFGALLNYMTYKKKRKMLYCSINDSHLPLSMRVNTLKQLLDTKIQTESYMRKEREYKRSLMPMQKSKSGLELLTKSWINETHREQLNSSSDSISKELNIGKNNEIRESSSTKKIKNKKTYRIEIEDSIIPSDDNSKDKPRYKYIKPRSTIGGAIGLNTSEITRSGSPEREGKIMQMNNSINRKSDNEQQLESRDMIKIQEMLNRAPLSPNNIQNNNANFLDEMTRNKVLDHLKKSKIGAPHEPEMDKEPESNQNSMRLSAINSLHLVDQKDMDLGRKDYQKLGTLTSTKNKKVDVMENQKPQSLSNEPESLTKIMMIDTADLLKTQAQSCEKDIILAESQRLINDVNSNKQLPRLMTHTGQEVGVYTEKNEEGLLKSEKISLGKLPKIDAFKNFYESPNTLDNHKSINRSSTIDQKVKFTITPTVSKSASREGLKNQLDTKKKVDENPSSKLRLPFINFNEIHAINPLTEREKKTIKKVESLDNGLNIQTRNKEITKSQIILQEKPVIKAINSNKKKIVTNHPNFQFGSISKVQIRFPFFGHKD